MSRSSYAQQCIVTAALHGAEFFSVQTLNANEKMCTKWFIAPASQLAKSIGPCRTQGKAARLYCHRHNIKPPQHAKRNK